MTIESLIQTCTQLGIKLGLAGENNDRLKVDAPKGALNESLRNALTARKPELIAFLTAQQADDENGEVETYFPERRKVDVEIDFPDRRKRSRLSTPVILTQSVSEAKPLKELPQNMT